MARAHDTERPSRSGPTVRPPWPNGRQNGRQGSEPPWPNARKLRKFADKVTIALRRGVLMHIMNAQQVIQERNVELLCRFVNPFACNVNTSRNALKRCVEQNMSPVGSGQADGSQQTSGSTYATRARACSEWRVFGLGSGVSPSKSLAVSTGASSAGPPLSAVVRRIAAFHEQPSTCHVPRATAERGGAHDFAPMAERHYYGA